MLQISLSNTNAYTHFNSGPAEPRYTLPLQNSVDQDQLAAEEVNWSGSTLFVIKSTT